MDGSFVRRWARWGRMLIVFGTMLGLLLGMTAQAGAQQTQSSGEVIYAITARHRLVTFRSDNPRAILSRQRVSGLDRGEMILGIDFRPATGELYALGSNSNLYKIALDTGNATRVNPQPFAVALSGTSFGFDFNPTVDRIRVVSNTGQNLRLHPDLGTVVDSDNDPANGIQPDGSLAYDATDTDGDPVDPNAGKQPVVVAAAYTNPDNDPNTGTTLYDIDIVVRTLAIQAPPNNGVLNTVAALMLDLSGLGADMQNIDYTAMFSSGGEVGFDISRSGTAYAVANLRNGNPLLVTIDLTSGRVVPVGIIGADHVVGLAVPTQ